MQASGNLLKGILLLSLGLSGLAQTSSKPPDNWIRATTLALGLKTPFDHDQHGDPDEIRKEMMDASIFRLIAKCANLEEADLTTVQLVSNPRGASLSLYQVLQPEKAFKALSFQLQDYYSSRMNGHSKITMLAALTNQAVVAVAGDADLAALLKKRPLLPAGLLRKEATGTTTNRAGLAASETIQTTIQNGKRQTIRTVHVPKVDEVSRWVSYSLVDGLIAWRYRLQLKPDGSPDSLLETKLDAKELDPKFQPLIKAVDDEVEVEMKRAGSFGKLGSVHTFWHLKKEKLKAKGIDWRSPAELNSNINFD